MLTNNFKVAPGQEYRFTERYKNVKYHWYCLKNNEDINSRNLNTGDKGAAAYLLLAISSMIGLRRTIKNKKN